MLQRCVFSHLIFLCSVRKPCGDRTQHSAEMFHLAMDLTEETDFKKDSNLACAFMIALALLVLLLFHGYDRQTI